MRIALVSWGLCGRFETKLTRDRPVQLMLLRGPLYLQVALTGPMVMRVRYSVSPLWDEPDDLYAQVLKVNKPVTS